jgi:hypothetical protein
MLPSSNTCCKNSLVSKRSSAICCSLRRNTLEVTSMPSGRVSFSVLGSWDTQPVGDKDAHIRAWVRQYAESGKKKSATTRPPASVPHNMPGNILQPYAEANP